MTAPVKMSEPEMSSVRAPCESKYLPDKMENMKTNVVITDEIQLSIVSPVHNGTSEEGRLTRLLISNNQPIGVPGSIFAAGQKTSLGSAPAVLRSTSTCHLFSDCRKA